MTTQLGRQCDGGHYTCTAPKECCKQGCCFVNSVRSPVFQSGNIVNPLFLGHWYFWLAVTATVAGILCACSLWKRHHQGGICCRNSGRDDRASEPESNGSCYAPPQYSRCNSFYQPPPPYSEVTSKPDLYPLVISFNGDPVIKANNGASGYFMVQYFRNFIVRPVGSISATSTLDSLSSSYICSATNEANIIVPPPYSGISSLEEVTSTNNPEGFSMTHSVSSSPSSDLNQFLSACSNNAPSSLQNTPSHRPPSRPHSRPHSVVSIRDNPCFTHVATNQPLSLQDTASAVEDRTSCDPMPSKAPKSMLTRRALTLPEGEDARTTPKEQQNPSSSQTIASSNASVRYSSLQFARNSTGDSNYPLVDVVHRSQQIGQQKSPPVHLPKQESRSRSYLHRIKAKTMYMPLHEGPNFNSKSKVSPNSSKLFNKGWLSKSAPTTPCGNFAPSFPGHKRNASNSQKNRNRMEDDSPLLRERDESDEETNRCQDS
ncbi:uncharacterized protein LOC123313452 [Coccinella septempunctata]|uniref:uncharacterized protein LOC123313452 n=1 Tax=Coccinella septempunctata TaxID=41139 RepID=UPI001D0637EB|nr:uncharacterized protein LOC123313452 [Coccinella septempunctata]